MATMSPLEVLVVPGSRSCNIKETSSCLSHYGKLSTSKEIKHPGRTLPQVQIRLTRISQLRCVSRSAHARIHQFFQSQGAYVSLPCCRLFTCLFVIKWHSLYTFGSKVVLAIMFAPVTYIDSRRRRCRKPRFGPLQNQLTISLSRAYALGRRKLHVAHVMTKTQKNSAVYSY